MGRRQGSAAGDGCGQVRQRSIAEPPKGKRDFGRAVIFVGLLLVRFCAGS
jgi:hypothetical protein